MTQKQLKETMEMLYTQENMEAYDELWNAVKTLWNLNLLDDKLHDAMIAEDHKLYEKVVVNG